MPSLTGQRIANYEIGPLIGAGGMGEVYRARDTQLHRDVAIKVLLTSVATDGERLARFNREAQVLASLNHPNIAHIHGVERGPEGPLLVLEFVEGPTLADRIAQGPLPTDEATAIAKQIADALEAAHERGIVHRDLKPANIKVDDNGTVKVLDFGLARAVDPQSGFGGELANSPTITSPAMTQAGMILGTAAYMSPEQAKGRFVDKRSDVWAFGCVLYEMLAGTRAFGGEDVTDTIAAVVRGAPDWSALPASTPQQIRLLLKRCLEKDRKARISDVGVARFLLNETIGGDNEAGATAPKTPTTNRSRWIAGAAGVIAGALLVAAAWWLSPAPVADGAAPVRFVYTPGGERPLLLQGNDRDVAIAPDGSFIVFRSGDTREFQSRLMLRATDATEARELQGTRNARSPVVSPDGRWIAFYADGELRRVQTSGGDAQRICRIGNPVRGMYWGDDDHIVFAVADTNVLRRVSASGGEPSELLAGPKGAPQVFGFPAALPGGRTALFTVFEGLTARIDALDLATGAQTTVLTGASDPAFLPSGHLVFANAGSIAMNGGKPSVSLSAIRFDATRLQPLGEPISVADGISMGATGGVNYAVSRRGDMTYVPNVGGSADVSRLLTWVDRKGIETPIDAPPRGYAVARLSPDGNRIALDIRDQGNDIWIWDVRRRALSSLSRSPGPDMSPVWTQDSRQVIWTSSRWGGNPNLYRQLADGTGTAEHLGENATNQFPTSLTPDGRTVLLFGMGSTLMDIYTVNLDEAGRRQRPLLSQPAIYEFGPEVSPDGKWLAYHSNESGEFEVYVRPFPNVNDGRWQISSRGGSRAAWSRNGRELFFLDADGYLSSAQIQTSGARFSAGPASSVLRTKYYLGSTSLGLDLRSYDVTNDGRRFLMIKEPAGATSVLPGMVVTLNWATELRKRLPAAP
jgi:Tol biopolymer transport system component